MMIRYRDHCYLVIAYIISTRGSLAFVQSSVMIIVSVDMILEAYPAIYDHVYVFIVIVMKVSELDNQYQVSAMINMRAGCGGG